MTDTHRSMGLAREVIPGMHTKMILHAVRPSRGERMCGPQRGAVMGALMCEGLAQDEAEAEKLAASGDIEFSPHIIIRSGRWRASSPSMPVFVFENKALAIARFVPKTKVWAKCCAMAAWGCEVIARLQVDETDLYPYARSGFAVPAQWHRRERR
ncbi:MAG: hypothetical protein U0559_01460 [Anaerolineae bacterium]